MIILTLIFLILLIIFPQRVSFSVAGAINMCLTSVIPALFPFMIASGLISDLKRDKLSPLALLVSRVFKISPACLTPLVLGFLCGYPIGGKALIDLYKNDCISIKELNRALPFVNNSGVGFMISMLGGAFFSNIKAGFIMYISHIMAALTFGFLSSFFYKGPLYLFYKSTPQKDNLLIKSIKGAVEGSLNIMGVISFFSALIALIDALPFINTLPFKGVIYGLLEMTNGVKFIALSALSFRLKCALCTFVVTFSGVSVFLQVKCFFEKINTASYFLSKMLCGAFSFIYCFFLI